MGSRAERADVSLWNHEDSGPGDVGMRIATSLESRIVIDECDTSTGTTREKILGLTRGDVVSRLGLAVPLPPDGWSRNVTPAPAKGLASFVAKDRLTPGNTESVCASRCGDCGRGFFAFVLWGGQFSVLEPSLKFRLILAFDAVPENKLLVARDGSSRGNGRWLPKGSSSMDACGCGTSGAM